MILPAGTAEKFKAVIASIPQDMRVWWRYHRVSAGETLAQVAQKYHSTATSIAEANGLEDGEVLRANTRLIIPATPGRREGEAERLAFSKHATKYKVRKGDTVLSVADDFGIPVERLRKWNRLKGNALKAGRTLTIDRPVAAGDSGAQTETVSRKARSGRTLTKAGKGKRLSAQKEEEEPVARSKSKKTARLVPAVASKKTHRVKQGETLTSIASTYNTTVAALKRDNRKVASNLQAGDVLVIKK